MFEQQGALGKQQADRVLHGIHIGDEVLVDDEGNDVRQIPVSCPRREGQERWSHLDAVSAEQLGGLDRLRSRVPLVEPDEDVVVDGLERAHDEQTPALGHLVPDLVSFEHVLDLGGDVEGELGPALVQRAHDSQRMAPPVEEIRVPEGDVLRSEFNELIDVGEHDVRRNEPDSPSIDHGNRAVPALVRAPVAGLDVADLALAAVEG